MSRNRTQPVTPADIRAHRIRIPVDCKSVFPEERARFWIDLLGTSLEVAYDPRLGPGKERSGVLYVGSILERLVRPNEVLILGRRNQDIALCRLDHPLEVQPSDAAKSDRPRQYRSEIHAKLIRVAIDGGTVTYSDLSNARGWIGAWLYRISHEEDSAGRPPLTAIVVRKGPRGHQRPSHGFVQAMQEIRYTRRGEAENAVWQRALSEVYAYWRPKLTDDPSSWPRLLPKVTNK